MLALVVLVVLLCRSVSVVWPVWQGLVLTATAPPKLSQPPAYTTTTNSYFYPSLMANVAPPPIPVPPFLNFLLSYISPCLPPPVYNALLTLLAHGLAFFSALLGLGAALISSRPSDWDAQKIIPPLITLLAAYLALASAVRTATWFARTTAWLIKWGIITAAVSAAAAWVMGAGNGTGNGGDGGIVPSLIVMVSDMLYGQSGDAAAGASAASHSNSHQRAKPRPQAWDSFDQHWEWQFEEQQWNTADTASPAAHVQQFVANALDRARDGSWLSIARGALQSFSAHEQTEDTEVNSDERRDAQQNDQTDYSR